MIFISLVLSENFNFAQSLEVRLMLAVFESRCAVEVVVVLFAINSCLYLKSIH